VRIRPRLRLLGLAIAGVSAVACDKPSSKQAKAQTSENRGLGQVAVYSDTSGTVSVKVNEERPQVRLLVVSKDSWDVIVLPLKVDEAIAPYSIHNCKVFDLYEWQCFEAGGAGKYSFFNKWEAHGDTLLHHAWVLMSMVAVADRDTLRKYVRTK
jgi:hypothetical protein